MARIKIITDSASDIPQYLVDKYNIGYMPICVVIDGKVHYDRYDLDGREYMKSLSEREEIPTTSMVPMEWMEKEFKSNLEDYDYQIFVSMSAKASGGNNAAHLLKEQIEDELEQPLDEIYSEFDEEAIGSASIGQVYRAKLKENGEEVAVKVQKPGSCWQVSSR